MRIILNNIARFFAERNVMPLQPQMAYHAAMALSTSATPSPSLRRDFRLDFFRGIALVFIFMDHIPDNALSYVTLRSFAFSDAADVFIFISGYTAALVYGRFMLREGLVMAAARVWRRVWQLYVAHLCLFMMYNAEVSYTLLHFDNPLFTDELGFGTFLDDPAQTFIRVLLLQFQPSLLNILPLYISLLLIFPLVLLAIRRNVWVALIPSALLYLAVQVWGINMPGYPTGTQWFFDPFAWQFLFVIAACLGFLSSTTSTPLPRWRGLLPAAIVIVVIGAVVQFSWTLHELFGRIPLLIGVPPWADDKTHLPPLRIVNMLALAYVVARTVPANAVFLTSPAGWLLVLCGQKSLYVFCLTILLSVIGGLSLSLVGNALIIQVAINMAGILIMILLALLLTWFDAGGRLPPRPGTVTA